MKKNNIEEEKSALNIADVIGSASFQKAIKEGLNMEKVLIGVMMAKMNLFLIRLIQTNLCKKLLRC